MKLKKKLFLLYILSISTFVFAQTSIPDANFENYLETHNANGDVVSVGSSNSMGNGIANDGIVSTSNIRNVTVLNVSSQTISNLTGIEDFTDLIQLDVSGNFLEELDLIENKNLQVLVCNNNLLKSLDLSELNKLNVVFAQNNQLTTLNVSNNPDINYLRANNNKLKSLDVTSVTSLEDLYCDNNSLTKLNIANGSNDILSNFNARINNNLSCIQVDNANNIGAAWEKDLSAIYSESCFTYVPDDNFEQALIDNGYDNLLDDYVETAELYKITNLNINAKGISDLTGIEALKELETLDISNNNNLGDLDFSNNTKLKVLDADFSGITSFNLSQNVLLETLSASSNYNLTLVNLSNNTTLKNLNVSSCGKIETLDLSNNLNLETIDIYDNKITTITTTGMTKLKSLNIASNPVSNVLSFIDNINLEILRLGNYLTDNLDLSKNTKLKKLYVSSKDLNSLDLSNNKELNTLHFQSTNINSLDLSQNTKIEDILFNAEIKDFNTTNFSSLKVIRSFETSTKLESLDVSKSTNLESVMITSANALKKINLKNGNNTNFNSSLFVIGNAKNLVCIEVDDPNYSTTNWTNTEGNSLVFPPYSKIPYTNFCYSDGTYIPDNNFEQALIDLGYDDTLDGFVPSTNINNISNLDVSNKEIADLTGIADFTALKGLNCSNNSLTSINVKENTLLETVKFQYNSLTRLDLSSNSKLTHIDAYANSLIELDVKNGNNTNVTYFRVSANSDLKCIQVDNAAFSQASFNNNGVWLRIPSNAVFSEDCATTLSIKNEEKIGFTVYPNPSRGEVTLNVLEKSNLKVYNISGKEVLSKTLNIGINQLNDLNISKGVYLFKLISNTKTSVRKVVFQ